MQGHTTEPKVTLHIVQLFLYRCEVPSNITVKTKNNFPSELYETENERT